MLTFIEEVEPHIYLDNKRKRTIKRGLFLCHCGNKKEVRIDSVKSGHTISCGCTRKLNCHHTTHGYSKKGGDKITTYTTWRSMKSRCLNENHKSYLDYGGKGIKVCERWENSFENFLEDMGEKPSKQHSLDRINNNGNYEPENCRWATQREQQRNRRDNRIIGYDGKTYSLSEWAELVNINQDLLWMRLSRGWTIEEALNTPIKRQHQEAINKAKQKLCNNQ